MFFVELSGLEMDPPSETAQQMMTTTSICNPTVRIIFTYHLIRSGEGEENTTRIPPRRDAHINAVSGDSVQEEEEEDGLPVPPPQLRGERERERVFLRRDLGWLFL